MLPNPPSFPPTHVERGDLSEKTSRRIQWQISLVLILFGGAGIWLYVSDWLYDDTVLQSDDSEVLKGSSNARRLAMNVPTYYAVSGGGLQTNLTKQDCTLTSAPCDGACTGEVEQDDIDDLKTMFLMVDTSALEFDKSSAQAIKDKRAILKPNKRGWMVWYSFQVVYMFCALAIVCDEFFVPSLECFVDEFGISMDVAGATFMAAGGSMPELFTSLIATFKDSEVGFAAIVGSAVFNVLFVIAVCAIASKETLTLTWWPLARDCSFYIMALLTVVAVFADNTVHYYEAIALLLEYCCYCTFMRFNGKVSKWAEEKLNAMKGNARKVTPEGEAGAQASAETSEDASKETQLNKPSMFRMGIVSLLTQNAYIYETAGIAAITEIEGDLDETFKKIDKDQDGFLSVAEMQELLKKMGCNPDSATLRAAMKRITKSGNELISYAAFKSWYIASEARIQSEVNRIFDKFDANKNGFLEPSEIKKVLKDLGHKSMGTVSDDDCKKIIEEIIKVSAESSDSASSTAEDPNEVQDLKNDKVNPLSEDKTSPAPPEDGSNKDKAKAITSPRDSPRDSEGLHISLQQFEKWYEKSFFYSQKMKEQELQKEAEEGGLDLEMPPKPTPTGDDDDAKNLRLWYSAMFWYIFTYPLVCVMYCTIPDVRTSKYKRNWRIAVLAFVCSLFWIGLFSNWLYECIVVVSATVKVPPAVAAVTVLAAGTSIPDLISSYVVARKNEADMAVSSSIGSNIFDVTVGLPLPWLLYTIVKWKPFDAIESKTLAVDILVLVAMIASVIGTVMCMKWQMTKMMGYIMLFLYLVFLVQNLLGQLPEGNPTIDYTQFR